LEGNTRAIAIAIITKEDFILKEEPKIQLEGRRAVGEKALTK